jgi:hypothetical protein
VSSCPWNKGVISIIHYNPIHTGAHNGSFSLGADDFRIQIDGPPILIPGTWGRVSLDFVSLILELTLFFAY